MLSEMPATIATCLGPAGVSTRPTMSGGKSACISRASLSVLYFHNSFIPLTFDTLRMFSFFCQAVRCGSPPSVSQSASAPPALRRDRSAVAGGDWAIGDWAIAPVCAAAQTVTIAANILCGTCRCIIRFSLLPKCKHPHRSAFRHFRIFAWKQAIEARLHRRASRCRNPTAPRCTACPRSRRRLGRR